MMRLVFRGPARDESPETFADFRLDAAFTHEETGRTIRVPGFFAADGRAADSGADGGSIWQINFLPPAAGAWRFEVSFRTGDDVAASSDPLAGESAGFMDGLGGGFVVPPEAVGSPLIADGDRYPGPAGGDAALQVGSSLPADLLDYEDFDGVAADRDYGPHLIDWRRGDPTWAAGEGKGLIGAVNYLAGEGLTALFVDAADGLGADDASVFDVSRLAQWDIVFAHAQRRGLTLHLAVGEAAPPAAEAGDAASAGAAETGDEIEDEIEEEDDAGEEADDGADDGGAGAAALAIQVRELVARFGHHEKIVWLLDGADARTAEATAALAALVAALDPYGRPVMLLDDGSGGAPEALLGAEHVDGVVLTGLGEGGGDRVAELVAASEAAGRPWIVLRDIRDPGEAEGSRDVGAGEIRAEIWSSLLAGAAGASLGAEIAAAADDGQDDAQDDGQDDAGDEAGSGDDDFRERAEAWDWLRAAREFFETHLPFEEMAAAPARAVGGASVFALEGDLYALHLLDARAPQIDLTGVDGAFTVAWYDPRTGGDLAPGASDVVRAEGRTYLGAALSDDDWVALLRRVGPSYGEARIEADAKLQFYDAAGAAKTYVFDDPTDSNRVIQDRIQRFGLDDALDLRGLGLDEVVYRVADYRPGALLVREYEGADGPLVLLLANGWGADAFRLEIGADTRTTLLGIARGGDGAPVSVVEADEAAATYDAAAGSTVFAFDRPSDSTDAATDAIVAFGRDDVIDLTRLGVRAVGSDPAAVAAGDALVAMVEPGLASIRINGPDDDFALSVRGDLDALLDNILF